MMLARWRWISHAQRLCRMDRTLIVNSRHWPSRPPLQWARESHQLNEMESEQMGGHGLLDATGCLKISIPPFPTHYESKEYTGFRAQLPGACRLPDSHLNTRACMPLSSFALVLAGSLSEFRRCVAHRSAYFKYVMPTCFQVLILAPAHKAVNDKDHIVREESDN